MLLCCAFLLLLPVLGFAQGDINPPGPPAATMKTLDQVEARTPVNGTNTPGDDKNEFIINRRGSYYLTGNILTTRSVGIFISTNQGVTLDLNGFTIVKAALPGGTGISIASGRVVVKNGFIRGFSSGASYDENADEGTFENLVVSHCSAVGLFGGRKWMIKNCTATENGGTGIQALPGSRIVGCIASGNGQRGIEAFNSTITDSTASDNKGIGITAPSGSTVSRCTVERNGGEGIIVERDSLVQENRLTENGLGTPVASGVLAAGDRNRVVGNSTTGNDKGILVSGRGNVIDGNHVRGNSGPGIEVTVANGKNIIIRNQAGENGGSYSAIAAGNNLAPVTAPENAANPYGNLLN